MKVELVGALAALALVAGCDPILTVNVGVRDPSHQPIADATVAMGCPARGLEAAPQYAAVTDPDGVTQLSAMMQAFPRDCDLFVAKPGFRTRQLRYAELCPHGDSCQGSLRFDLVLEPE